MVMRKLLIAPLFAAAALSCKSRSNEPPADRSRPAADQTGADRPAPAAKPTDEPSPAADNTARNKRDDTTTPTADTAVHSTADLELTQKLRQAVMDDDSLSTNAHNSKIVVQNGTVTLAGPVASEAERKKLVDIATRIAGEGKVVSQLEVTP
jgi:hypothetical protein